MTPQDDEQKLRETINVYDRVADAYVERNKLLGTWIGPSRRMERFQAHLPAPALVLDLGCGPGHDTANLANAGYDVFGLDLSGGMLAQAQIYAGGPLVLADMRRIPFASGSFDGLWACASLLHVPRVSVPEVMADCRRILKLGGLLYISVKQGSDQFTESDGWKRTFTLFEVDELIGLVEAAGFRVTARHIDESPRATWINVYATSR